MQKTIIGVSSPNNKTTRAAIAMLAEEFCIEHINMRQPLIEIVAQLTAINPCSLEHYCPQTLQVEHLGISVEELEIALGFNLRTIKSDFFVSRCAEKIAISNSGFNGQLFSGQIISGLKTELEAQWIREQGGHVVHLYQYDNLSHHHPLNELDGDLVCVIDQPTDMPNLREIIQSLREKIYPTLQAA
jgi:hypothetical protein